MQTEKNVKIGLGILLLLCLLSLPYGFYQAVRVAAMVGFGFLAYHAHQRGEATARNIFLVLLVLFQPLVKISLGRTLWNVVDLVAGIGLLVSAFSGGSRSGQKE